MYIHDRLRTASDHGQERVILHMPRRRACGCARPGLGDPVPPRRPLKDDDVPVSSTTAATTGIARRVRDAIVKMSRTSDATLQNTAQRVVDGDVTLRFVGDLKPVAHPEAVLQASGVSAGAIVTALQTNTLMEIPGSDPALVPKTGTVRAFQRNGVIYIPTTSSEPNLSTDIIHEVNHWMNPIRANAATDRAGFLWESFTAEARASYVADYRAETGISSTANISLRLEKSLQHAREQAEKRMWTSWPEWNAAFEARVRSWTPNGNLDNHK
jgi:hypothetical protein